MGCLTSKTNVVTPASKDVIERQINNDRSNSPKLEDGNMVDSAMRPKSQQHFYGTDNDVTPLMSSTQEDDEMERGSNTVQEGERHHPKAVAFDVTLVGPMVKIPQRFQRLEPLQQKPVVTAELLDEKQKQAHDRKKKIIQSKKSRRASRLRREVNAARELNDREIFDEVEWKIEMKHKGQPKLSFQDDQEAYDPIYDDNDMEVDQLYNTEQDGELDWLSDSNNYHDAGDDTETIEL